MPYIKAGDRATLYSLPDRNARKCGMRIKDFEQANLALFFPSVSAFDPEASVCALTSVAFGGGMSSRLFQSVRERKGLAYSVYSSPSAYKETGAFNIYLNISEENTDKVLSAVREEIDLLTDKRTYRRGTANEAKFSLNRRSCSRAKTCSRLCPRRAKRCSVTTKYTTSTKNCADRRGYALRRD